MNRLGDAFLLVAGYHICSCTVNNHQYFYTVNDNKHVVLMTEFCAVLNFINATDHRSQNGFYSKKTNWISGELLKNCLRYIICQQNYCRTNAVQEGDCCALHTGKLITKCNSKYTYATFD